MQNLGNFVLHLSHNCMFYWYSWSQLTQCKMCPKQCLQFCIEFQIFILHTPKYSYSPLEHCNPNDNSCLLLTSKITWSRLSYSNNDPFIILYYIILCYTFNSIFSGQAWNAWKQCFLHFHTQWCIVTNWSMLVTEKSHVRVSKIMWL